MGGGREFPRIRSGFVQFACHRNDAGFRPYSPLKRPEIPTTVRNPHTRTGILPPPGSLCDANGRMNRLMNESRGSEGVAAILGAEGLNGRNSCSERLPSCPALWPDCRFGR